MARFNWVRCKCGCNEFVVETRLGVVKILENNEGLFEEYIDDLLFPKYKYFCGKCNARLKGIECC